MTTEPMIPLAVPDLRGNEAAYLQQCVVDNWVSSAGPFVGDLEKRMAALCGRAHGVATVNGTTALQLALVGVGVGPGDLVVVPDWTFAATANAVAHAGATPVFVDVDRTSWTLDPELLGEAIDHHKGAVKVVIVVDTLGHPADMDAIVKACAEAKLPLIEDAAGAVGATYKGQPAGCFGRAGVFSFNGNKTVTAGGGGIIVTDDQRLAEETRALSTQSRTSAEYRYEKVGFNYRMTNVNAALAIAQLERAEEMVAAKRRIATAYDSAVSGRTDLRPMPRLDWAESGCWLYSVLTASAHDARDLVAAMRNRGIEARTFWHGLSGQQPYADFPRHLRGVSVSLSGTVVSLPCSSHLTEVEQARVVSALSDWRGSELDRAA